MTSGPDRLYELLPILYRSRDPDQGSPLRALLGVAGEEYDRMRASIARLEASWFIETCDPAVIPFIGDLVGVPRVDVARVPDHTRRSFVGNAVRLRRRKGIAAALERAVGDATGWSAHAIEMFEHLGITQHVDHPHADRGRLFDARAAATLVPEPGVEPGAHTADARSPDDPGGPGRFNLQALAVLVSRLTAYPVEQGQPRKVGEGSYTFHPLGLSTPLFTQPRSDNDPLRPHALTDLAARIPEGAFAADLAAYAAELAADLERDPLRAELRAGAPSRWFGEGASIEVRRDRATIPPDVVVARDLAGWERPAPGQVAVDVRLGRMTFPAGEEPGDLRASWSFGRVADLGAGPYARPPSPAAPAFHAEVCASWPAGPLLERRYRTLHEALADWGAAGGDGLVSIQDSSTYEGAIAIPLGARSLRIEAHVGEVPVVPALISVSGEGGSLTLEGLELGGGAVTHGPPSGPSLVYAGRVQIALTSCTVHGSIEERDPQNLDLLAAQATGEERRRAIDLLARHRISLTLTRCLVGPVRLADPTDVVVAVGSILDGRGQPAVAGAEGSTGPSLSLSTTTVIGDVAAEVLLAASECLFTGAVRLRRVQPSVLRHSAVPYASRDLPRYRSVLFGAPPEAPEADAIAGEPRFSSLDPAQPEYGRLADGCPAEILGGAADGGEIGALHDAWDARRRAALRAVLGDFVPQQLTATVLFLDR